MNDLFSDIENLAMTLRAILQEAPKRLESNLQEVCSYEKEIMDIEHVLELTNFHASKGYAYAKDIQQARKRRRELKDEIELLSPLVDVIEKMKANDNQLNKVVGEVRRVKQRHGARTYRMRIRQDLQHEVDRQNERLLEVVK